MYFRVFEHKRTLGGETVKAFHKLEWSDILMQMNYVRNHNLTSSMCCNDRQCKFVCNKQKSKHENYIKTWSKRVLQMNPIDS